ncbi:MAG: shikimate dehydrogenase [Acidobacteria bacterium]|nr:shikimate dehydrogenase [Acidobacteriota bacterium]
MNNTDNRFICIPITESTSEAFLSAILEASQQADIIELRLDYLSVADRSTVLSKLPALAADPACKDLLLTFRPRQQGGHQDLSLEDRQTFWRLLPPEVIAASRFVDFEFDLVESWDAHSPVPWEKVICSWHNFEETANDLLAQYDRMAATPAAIVKIATMANRITDCLKTFELIEHAKDKKPVIALAMSFAGVATRILSLASGSFLTFGSLRKGAESAAGQVTASDLTNLYRVTQLNRESEIFGIIGFPVAHSRSPIMHNAVFSSYGRNAAYLPFEVQDAGEFIRDFVRPETKKFAWPLRGLSVTIPHKLAVIPYLDYVDSTAKTIGAVNTIVVENGKLSGFNTDIVGAMKPLEELVELSGVRVAVLGAGGSARAICHGLNQRGAETTIFARDLIKAAPLAEEFTTKLERLDNFSGDFDVVINCTPIGMRHHSEGQSPLTAKSLLKTKLVYDLIYTPNETALLLNAKTAGCQTLGGMSMLIGQAVEQMRLWLGLETTFEVMRKALESRES